MDRAEEERDLADGGKGEFRQIKTPNVSSLGCVEDAFEARTKLADFFSTLLLGGPRPSVEKTHYKTSGCYTSSKYRTDYQSRRNTRSPRFTTSKFPTQIRHMGFRPKPFIL